MSGWFTAASGGTIYDGDAFPKEYVGNVFTGDVSGNLVHRDILEPRRRNVRGAAAPRRTWSFWPLPTSGSGHATSPMRPTAISTVTDIYRQVIETPESIPEEIRKKIDFYNGDTLGRIYRIVPNHPLRQGDLKPNLGAASSAELVKQLANPNGWHRQTAHRLLLERQDRSVIPALQDDGRQRHDFARSSRARSVAAARRQRSAGSGRRARAMKDTDSRIREHALRTERAAFWTTSPPLAEQSGLR